MKENFINTFRKPGKTESPSPLSNPDSGPIYLGQLFNLFLLCQYQNKLYIIDQHAAHEKIIFEKLRSSSAGRQKLLIPLKYEFTEDETAHITKNIKVFKDIGIEVEKDDKGNWIITAVPEQCSNMEIFIIEFIRSNKGTKREMEQELYAEIACKAAVKDGELLDNISAEELIYNVFQLQNARCPHGRPIWYEISRDDLFQLVGRKP